MKTCTKCKIEQPLSEFQKAARTKDGLQYWCKSCYRARWSADPERNARNNAAYRARNRDDLLEKKRAYAAANRDREAARAREWSLRNPGRKRAWSRKWEQENPERATEQRRMKLQRRRARERNQPVFVVSPKDVRRILASPCAVRDCASRDIQIDHVVPIARGGSHGVGNLQPLCASHNQSKGAKTWIEFRAYLALKAQVLAA